MKKEIRELNAPAIDLIADILDKHVDAILGEVRIRFKQIKSDQSSEPAEPVKCAGCEGKPAPGNNPCAVCGKESEPMKSHLKVSYDAGGDCLYVVCDSNEPADAEEDDNGILYRRAISDGRLVGITIMNFMGRHAEWSDDVQRPAEPVKVPSDDEIIELRSEFDWREHYGNIRFARALLARYGKGTP